ncbi:MAG TPA: oxidoreductase, partial [Archangium sp.]|nr:oxidoreductase [Archangium sp.]
MKDAAQRAQIPLSAEPPSALSLDEVRRCTSLLEAIADNRFLLVSLPEPERIAFLAAAGRVVH